MKTYGKMLSLVSALSLVVTTMGCAVSAPAPETDGETILLNEQGAAALPGTAMRIERAAGAATFSLAQGAGGRLVAPGVWEIAAEDGERQQIVAGEDGHRWLVEQAEAALEALQAQQDADEEGSPELAQKLTVAQQKLEATRRSLASILGDGAPQGPQQALAVSCNISRYTGASGPVTSPPAAGAAALAQIVCSGGCVTFTVNSTACCSTGCSSAPAQTGTVCATPWTTGTIRLGSGFGAASVNVNPPNITQTSSSFVCQ